MTPTKVIVAQNNDMIGKRSEAASNARKRSRRRAESGNTGCCGTFRRGRQTRGDKKAIETAKKYGYVCPTDMSKEERIRADLPDEIWWDEDENIRGMNK